jgi:hypothetical protein
MPAIIIDGVKAETLHPKARLARARRPHLHLLVNQTFRKLQTHGAGTLTCFSPFHMMNKQ